MLQQWSRCLGIAICIFRIKKRSCQVWQGWFLFVNELRRGFCVPFRKLTYHIPPLENHDHLQKCLSRGSVRFLDSGGFVWMLRCVKDVWSYTFVGGMSDQYRSFGLPMSQSAKCLTFLNCWPLIWMYSLYLGMFHASKWNLVWFLQYFIANAVFFCESDPTRIPWS